MHIEPFALERYFARHEFSARYLLSCSDCEPLTMEALLSMADAECRRLWENLKLAYTESRGLPALRSAIAEAWGMEGKEQVLCSVPEEGIFLAMHALHAMGQLEPGAEVICTVPAYQSLTAVAASLGCEVKGWAPRESQGWRFELDDLRALMGSRTALLVVNVPHNPTGATLSAAELAAIAGLAAEHAIPLFCDEMYRGLELEGDVASAYSESLPTAASLPGWTLSLSGLSKSYGLPGLRTGWLASRDARLLDTAAGLKDYTTICAPAPVEVLSLIALRNRDAIIAAHRARVRRHVQLLGEFVAARPGRLSWHPPRAGSVCLLRLEGEDESPAFCDALLADEGVMLAPSTLFDWGTHHVRVGLGRQDFPEVLTRFGRWLDQTRS